MSKLFEPMDFIRGPDMKNRFMLAPLTNSQSHDDGVLSEEEFHWLTMRAKGGFGLTMTCAAHVQAVGQGFPGQLGVFGDEHLEGLTRLAAEIKVHGSVAICQLHHAGMRSPAEIVGTAVCPSDNDETGAVSLSNADVKVLVSDFVEAAVRCQNAGFDGVELHGAHGYILCQFLSAEINHRTDEYGGSLTNRSRIIREIITGIRDRCERDFCLGLRLSPERFGLKLAEIIELARDLMAEGNIDFLDMSLWDVFKEPVEEEFKGKSLLSYFTDLERNSVRLGIAGKIRTPEEAEQAFATGVDWIMLGRAAIIHHDFPNQYQQDVDFAPLNLPVTVAHLEQEGLSGKFVKYMGNWSGFVAEQP
ncbi:MAG: 2,4-dienoyl-CoA reductase-like NADH-dependent reductase (Old Yellow Enzyme family) [Candidatus Azotimanducaceae bacterium]|jgi:2,4-dienoyl-CoA reductase-like NADH-dependent reductase (Old Yellow Enzyme family)